MDNKKISHRVRERLGERFKHFRSHIKESCIPIGISLALLAIVVACLLLWQRVSPAYLAAVGAALAAFLAPIPGLVDANSRSKWLFTIAISALIGGGTWFATNDLDAKRHEAEVKTYNLQKRLLVEENFLESRFRDLSPAAKDELTLDVARGLQDLFNERNFESVRDLSVRMLAALPGNGHALYFAGEAYRVLRDRTDMRGAFQHYLAQAGREPKSRDGDANACSGRVAGYCGERTAYIDCLMANDYLDEARTLGERRKISALKIAFDYEKRDVGIRCCGFNDVMKSNSSDVLFSNIATQLRDLGQNTSEIEAEQVRFRERCDQKPPDCLK